MEEKPLEMLGRMTGRMAARATASAGCQRPSWRRGDTPSGATGSQNSTDRDVESQPGPSSGHAEAQCSRLMFN